MITGWQGSQFERRVPIFLDQRQGIRRLEVDLTGVPRIDAAGVGELVRAYNMTAAAAGVLQIRNTTPWVRHVLELVGLFTVLSEGEPLPG